MKNGLKSPSGLYLTKYRAYQPNTGRWLSTDPIKEKGGINLYEYCLDSPMGLLDPLGLTCGVMYKVLILDIFRKNDEVGHCWLGWSGGSVGFWPGTPVGVFHPSAPPLMSFQTTNLREIRLVTPTIQHKEPMEKYKRALQRE